MDEAPFGWTIPRFLVGVCGIFHPRRTSRSVFPVLVCCCCCRRRMETCDIWMKFHLDGRDPSSWLGFARVFIQEEWAGRSFASLFARSLARCCRRRVRTDLALPRNRLGDHFGRLHHSYSFLKPNRKHQRKWSKARRGRLLGSHFFLSRIF